MEILAITVGAVMIFVAIAVVFSPVGDLFTWRVRCPAALLSASASLEFSLVAVTGEPSWLHNITTVGMILGAGLIWAARKRTRWIPKVR